MSKTLHEQFEETSVLKNAKKTVLKIIHTPSNYIGYVIFGVVFALFPVLILTKVSIEVSDIDVMAVIIVCGLIAAGIIIAVYGIYSIIKSFILIQHMKNSDIECMKVLGTHSRYISIGNTVTEVFLEDAQGNKYVFDINERYSYSNDKQQLKRKGKYIILL